MSMVPDSFQFTSVMFQSDQVSIEPRVGMISFNWF